MKQKILSQGAEAKIILQGDFVIKDRIKKSYRIPELDNKIRKQRTKAETKLLEKASRIINCPAPLTEKKINKKMTNVKSREKFKTKIIMPFIDGKKLSEHLNDFPLKKQKQICKKIGESIVKLHNADIIHNDLTTSNMILVEKEDNNLNVNKRISNVHELINKKIPTSEASSKLGRGGGNSFDFKIFFIDFGLGFISQKSEDKAVDLHLLKQALEAKHFENWKELWKEIEKSYKFKDSKIILERLRAVEKRGRYKEKD